MNDIQVSVIITTKNAEIFIENCIKSIKASYYKNIEIIVVDNYSTDNTLNIAKNLGARTFIKGPERSAQRNYGAKNSIGEIIGFLDVDMTITENVISQCVMVLEDKNVVGVYIPEKIFSRNFFNRVRNFERSFYDATVIDAARFFRRDDFINVGGYDASLNGTEDWDLDRRIKNIRENAELKSIKSPLYHREYGGLKSYVLKKSYYASNFKNYFKKWGHDKTTKKQFGIFYRYIGVFIENGKWKKLFLHPIYSLSVYFLRFLIGIVYLLSKLNISKKKNVYENNIEKIDN